MCRILFLFFALAKGATAFAQVTEDQINVYLDCPGCDLNYVKNEIKFVNYANDPLRAQVHILVSSQTTGSSGAVHQLEFLGKEGFDDDKFTLEFQAEPTMTSLEKQQGLVRTIKLGLIPFVAQTTMVSDLDLSVKNQEKPKETTPVGKSKKLLDSWLFEVFSSFNWDNESLRSTFDLRYGMHVEYVTPEWRIRIDPNFYFQERVVRTDEEEIRSYRRQNGYNAKVVKSLGDHWSVGVFNNIYSNTYNNVKFGMWLAPAIEYSFLPYSEVVTREFTLAYHVGRLHNRYFEETIFLKMEDEVYSHVMDVNLHLRRQWGDVTMFMQGSCFLNDWSRNHLSINGRVGLRVFKGMTFNMGGTFRIVNDQITLPRGDTTLEDILLGQKQLATAYNSNVNFGVRYTFGALYNNVVNTRL
ncbi:MAG: hypothetical protein SFV55_27300 [Haliscomenobacter sp.]|uniref:hypothetical protein n=1 Tax=Haliscomenobacter sp. TaxID=2717303 RepID=UPI0029B1C1A7|nr:hypothetical protein [Haliscomenobacter sp.]MDX2072172.1 hypothetical protein [Haliscomenobacter sp.]